MTEKFLEITIQKTFCIKEAKKDDVLLLLAKNQGEVIKIKIENNSGAEFVQIESSNGFHLHNLKKGEKKTFSYDGKNWECNRVNYDFLIVGGGTAGITLAKRLSEQYHVAVFETGSDNLKDPEIVIPSQSGTLLLNYTNKLFAPLGHSIDTPRRFPIVEGETLGGGSSINGMQWSQGVPHTYNEWAVIADDDAWNAANAFEQYKRMEKFAGVLGEYTPSAHGYNGPIDVRQATNNLGVGQQFTNAFADVTGLNNKQVDYNDFSNQFGSFKYWQLTQQPDRTRESSWTAYIGNDLKQDIHDKDLYRNKRKTLSVYANSRVLSFIYDECAETPTVVGLNVLRGGVCFKFYAGYKVILSAGLQSCLILLQNGIGDKVKLDAIGVKTLVNNPNVGKCSFNHPIISLTGVPPTGGVNPLPAPGVGFDDQGLYAGGAVFADIDPNLRAYQMIAISGQNPAQPTAQPTSFTLATLMLLTPCEGFFDLYSALATKAPKFSFDYFSQESQIQSAVRLYITEYNILLEMDLVPANPAAPLPTAPYDDIKKYVLATYGQAYHWTGMCLMGTSEENGVVDSDCNVFGVEGLAVCDVTICPLNASGNTQAIAYLVANVLADKILNQ